MEVCTFIWFFNDANNFFQISQTKEERRNVSINYNPLTVRELQTKFPYINWLDYFKWFLRDTHSIDENEVVIVRDLNYFQQLHEILKKTPKRTIANYLIWQYVYFSYDLFQAKCVQRTMD